MSRIFLLSPANCGGTRAKQALSPNATFALAVALRSAEGAPLGDLFSFMSGLYFRGKLTYACRFGRAFVITPDQGLIPAETPITRDVLVRYGDGDIRLENAAYRAPLEATARSLADHAGAGAQFVLLGSVASAKYVDVLGAIFGSRLVFPSDFVGRGDMSRGGLMLRAADAGQELRYEPVLGAVRHGPRPARLEPLTRRRR